jgi:PiT family inorganic phosphate transporter
VSIIAAGVYIGYLGLRELVIEKKFSVEFLMSVAALGAAYAAGQFALTTILVVGFALHNGTEGIAISGPVSDISVRLREPAFMGFLAGFPTVIGSIIGYGLMVHGSVDVSLLTRIVIAWIVSPLLSAGLAVMLYVTLRRVFSGYIDEKKVQRAITLLFIISLCFSAYSFGANDVGNATGVYVTVAQKIGNMPDYNTMVLLASFGALGIAIGGLTWGGRVVMTVAYRIVRLDPLSGLSAETANALVVFLFVTIPYTLIGYGLPVSTSISSVGAIIGVGLVKDRRGVNKGTIVRMILSWIATPISTAILCITIYAILSPFNLII